MTKVKDLNFPVKQIIVTDKYVHPKGSMEALHLEYHQKIGKFVEDVKKKRYNERNGWK